MQNTKVPFIMPQNVENADEVSTSLANFYKSLGWNPDKSMLDVRKIRISEKDYNDMASMYLASGGDEGSITSFLINYMPSTKQGIDGMVIIEQGAF